jgi:hypothetical protein
MPDDHAEREAFLRDLARQVRIRRHAGKTEAEVSDWLQSLGLSTEVAAYLLATCPCGEARRRRKSRYPAATEPDAAFALPGDSYAQVLAREITRSGWGRIATVVLAVLVSLPLGLGLLRLLLIR